MVGVWVGPIDSRAGRWERDRGQAQGRREKDIRAGDLPLGRAAGVLLTACRM